MTGFGKFIGVVALLVCVVGCEDDRPVYAAPNLVPQQISTLRGCWGTYIEEVDGARIPDATIMWSNWGGDIVPVKPGTHALHVVASVSSGRSGLRTEHWFRFRCEAGHTYDVSPKSLWQPSYLRITDKTTGQSMVLENRVLLPEPGFMGSRADPFNMPTGRDPTRE